MDEKKNTEQKTLTIKRWIPAGIAMLIMALVIGLFYWIPRQQSGPQTISLSQVAADISAGKIERIEDEQYLGMFEAHYAGGEIMTGLRDPGSSLIEQLSLLGVTTENLAKVKIEIVRGNTQFAGSPAGMFFALALVSIPFMAVYLVSRRDRYSKKTYKSTRIPSTRFEDVAGLDENLPELQDIVTFLKEGNRYAEMGATPPRGVLMVGDPGTGKTLVARAIAGEAGVPFFATSGSEFVEVFVGIGASRIRSLFSRARKKAPCIVFIDEIDAVGRARHRSESGAEQEQDQTLNQLLVEMDGFSRNEGVIVLAATNRLDVLDPALTRPGRFDRRIHIHRPDVKGREGILKVHTRTKRLGENVNLAMVAKATPGLVGSDLANIVNEAAISAVRNKHTGIEMTDFEEAIEKVLAGGVARKGYVMRPEERKIVAYHEAGHAVVMHETPLSDPVYKITIIPRGQMGGYTMALPEEDQLLISRCKMLARITGLLGGRAAEEIFFQDITNGASNDLNVATQMAEEMVMRLGMERSTGLRVIQQRHILAAPSSSQKTFENIDEAVNNLLETCYADARRILLERKAAVERLAAELLEIETVDRDGFFQLMQETTPMQSPTPGDSLGGSLGDSLGDSLGNSLGNGLGGNQPGSRLQ